MLQPILHLRDLRRAGQADGRFELTRSPIRIGRGPRCEIRLHSDEIADVQVILRRDGQRWLIHPVGPADGCRFNGEPLAETQNLDLGTKFTIGHVELTLGDAQAATRPTVADFKPVIHELSVPELVPTPQPAPEPVAVAPAAPVLPEPVAVVEPVRPVTAKFDEPAPEAAAKPVRHTPGLEFEQTGLLADLARRALEKSHRRQQIPTLTTPKAASAAVAMTQPLAEMPIGRALPTLSAKRPAASADAATSLSDWADEFSRRYRQGQIPARPAETPAPAAGPAYEPKPLPRFRKVTHHTEAGTSFLGSIEQPARPVPEPIAETKPVASPADFPSVVMQLQPSEQVQTQEHCFHEPAVAFHEVQWTTDYESHIETDEIFHEPAIDDRFADEQACLIELVEPEPVAFVNEPALVAAQDVAEEMFEESSGDGPPTVPIQLSESLTPEKFEEWISSVGSILGDLQQQSSVIEAIGPIGPDVHQAIDDPYDDFEDDDAADDEAYGLDVEILAETDVEDASAEADIVIADYPLDDVTEDAAPLVIETVVTAVDAAATAISAPVEAVAEAEIESAIEIAPEPEAAVEEPDADEPEYDGQWPSVQDIMRWSAVREGEMGDDQPADTHTMLGQADDDIAPHQIMRVNLPVAGMICLAWLGLSAVLVRASMRVGVQDELTQKTISAINSASLNNSVPRMPAGQINKLGQVPSWWSITGDQIWWRATFLKMREQNGQAAAEASGTLAERAVAANPLLPQGRLWNAMRQQAGANAETWAGLSRDVVSLLVTADHLRRIGDDEQANAADRQALELATAPDRILMDRKVLFDAELGTGRFLLPNQKDVVEILKRLAKEPNAAELIAKIMPADRPLVWLTAAQFLKQAGLGDPEPELTKILAWTTPSRASLDQQRVEQAIRAEALAMQGKTVDAAEIYMQLTQNAPASVWKRAWFFNHGDLSHRNQKTEAALVSWRKARGDDPNHEVDRHAIQASRSLTSSAGAADTSRNTIRTN